MPAGVFVGSSAKTSQEGRTERASNSDFGFNRRAYQAPPLPAQILLRQHPEARLMQRCRTHFPIITLHHHHRMPPGS